MGLRFRKSIKIADGLKLNLSKSGVSVSAGKRGARYTVSSSGRRTATVGIPGTGISYSKTFGTKKKKKSSKSKSDSDTVQELKWYQKPWGLMMIVLMVVILVLAAVKYFNLM